MKTPEEPPFLTVGTDVSAKYRGAFCEAKITSAKILIKAKVTFKPGSATGEVHDEHIRGPLQVGATVQVKNSDGVYQEAVINKLTDASLYTVVFDDGDEKTMRRSCLCLKGARHFAESESLDQLPLTHPEHFGAPVIRKETTRGRRSKPVKEEESSSSSGEENDEHQLEKDKLLGKVVCVDAAATSNRKKCTWFPALVISPDCSDHVTTKKDSIFVRSFKDGKFSKVPRKNVRLIDRHTAPKPEANLKLALDGALEFLRCGAIPSNWRSDVKISSSEEDDDDDDEEDGCSGEDEGEVEPFPEERLNFLQQLYKFMKDRGTPINKKPVLAYRTLNLFKLFRLVHNQGGFSNIDSGSIWKQVFKGLGIPVMHSAAGYNVKCAYRKYLHGFEEYCASTGITFQMALPQRVGCKSKGALGSGAGSPVTAGNWGVSEQKGVVKEQHSHTNGEPGNLLSVVCKKEEDPGSEKLDSVPPKKEEEDQVINRVGCSADREAARKPHVQNVKLEKHEKRRDRDNFGEREGEFESYPTGMKVQVRYGRGRNQKTYEATVKQSDLEGGEVLYLVHYCGWNVRYDEWIKADKIVQPVNKYEPKVKPCNKIKDKKEREKDMLERPTDREDVPPAKNNPMHCSSEPSMLHDGLSPLDSHCHEGAKHPAAKSLEITPIHNGLQASERSAKESVHEEGDGKGDRLEDEQPGSHDDGRKAGPQKVLEPWESSRGLPGGCRRDLGGADNTRVLEHDRQDCTKDGKQWGPSEPQGERACRKRKAEAPVQRTLMEGTRSRPRSCGGTVDWLPHSPPSGQEEGSAGFGETNSSSSSSSSSEDEWKGPVQTAGRSRSRAKGSKKSSGQREKTKGQQSPAFSEGPEKCPKLAPGADERSAGSRGKGQKDVWSSIQAQWPKKTLKELFSDSDTEAGSSPPPAKSKAEGPRGGFLGGEVGQGSPKPQQPQEPPSSGSNSVLNTPPTTPESPPGSLHQTHCPAPPPALPQPLREPTTEASPPTPDPQPEESMGGRSETGSSMVEVESLGEELPPEDRAGCPPVAFDGSPVCNSSCSSQLDGQQGTTAAALPNQKRRKDSQGGGASKKHKRSHKHSGTHHKKSRKLAHSSDSEDHGADETTAKSPALKTNAAMPKCPSGTTPPAGHHKNHKQRDPEQQGHTPRTYKWSFQMSDLEEMTSLERIAFLQEKIQDVRSHYLSLKSEVASIDRRRKRLKKKERERTAAASTSSSSSSSSSPSSSSLTAEVMLTLAEPTVSSSSQNSGLSGECR